MQQLCLGLCWQADRPSDGVRTAQSKDMKDAGHDTKTAAKDVGHGTKTGTKKVYHATKHGTKKAWDKTKNTTKEGAADSQGWSTEAFAIAESLPCECGSGRF